MSMLKAACARPADSEYQHGSNAEQLAANRMTHVRTFYNVGWMSNSKRHTVAWLAQGVIPMLSSTDACAIGISEVFNQKDDDLKNFKENIIS